MSGVMEISAGQTVDSLFDAATVTRINEAARSQHRPGGEILAEAVDAYLAGLAWLEAQVREAEADEEAGRVFSEDVVKDRIRGLGYAVD